MKLHMKILQYIQLPVSNSVTQVSLYKTFHFLRYAQLRYAKCLFMIKISVLFKKMTKFTGKKLKNP